MNNKVSLISVIKTDGQPKAEVVCNFCGKKNTMWLSHFYRGSSPCDCKHHKKNNKRLFSIWSNMKSRCHNPKAKSYSDYGGRGITVCDEWQEFQPFLEWAMANGYSDNLTIDRINNNGNYTPFNCKWSTLIEQANNKRNNVMVNLDGKAVSLRRFCELHGLKYKSEHQYYKRKGYLAEINRLNKYIELDGQNE